MKKGFKEFDVVDFLDDLETQQAYFDVALKSQDPEKVVRAIGDIARARGIAKVAKKMDMNRENLYKSLFGKAKPKFETVFKAMEAIGLEFTIKFCPKKKFVKAIEA